MKEFTSANFDAEVLGASVPVVVDFYATWCGPCKMMAPIMEKMAEEFEGKALIGKLDVDECGDIAGRYGVMSIPTIILFKDGAPVNKLVGLQNKDGMKKAIEAVI